MCNHCHEREGSNFNFMPNMAISLGCQLCPPAVWSKLYHQSLAVDENLEILKTFSFFSFCERHWYVSSSSTYFHFHWAEFLRFWPWPARAHLLMPLICVKYFPPIGNSSKEVRTTVLQGEAMLIICANYHPNLTYPPPQNWPPVGKYKMIQVVIQKWIWW